MEITFTKVALEYGWLGNMSPFSITYNGVVWPTAEHLFQALRFDDILFREKIRAEKSPMGAKFLAKANSSKMSIEPLLEEDLANMRLVLRLKIEQHPVLEKELLATGTEVIIEDVTKRNKAGNYNFWGAALIDGEWRGRNVLGKLWMELRDQIRKEKSNA